MKTGTRGQGPGAGGSGPGRFARRALLATALLTGCAGTPPPPDWKLNAHSGLETYAKLHLEGSGKLAETNFARARAEIARTGRLDLAARAELYRCAVRAAALDYAPCAGFEALRPHAATDDLAYASFLAGDSNGLDAKALPKAYADLLAAKDEAARLAALEGIADPLSRLIGASVAFRMGQSGPAMLALATRAASDQGWRRPLLAWLEVQRQRAAQAGDAQALDTLTQRIRLVEQSMPKP